ATSTMPIVFGTGEDPVKESLVPSINRPGANMTGATFFTALLEAKRLGLLRELVPKAEVIALLINQNSSFSQGQAKDVQEAARDLGQRVVVLNGGSDADIDAAFASLAQHQAGRALGRGRSVLQRKARSTDCTGRAACGACNLPVPRLSVGGWSEGLRRQHQRPLPAGRGLCRSHSQGRQARRPAGHAADQIRAGDQSQDR